VVAVSVEPTQTPRKPPPTPRGLFRLGSIGGIPVTVANSWFLILLLITIVITPQIQDVAPELGGLAYVAGLAYAILLYLSVLLHEISHALAARRFEMNVLSINLHFLGGVTEIDGEATTPWREFVIAVVGPLTSIAVGGVALLGANSLDWGLLGFTALSLAVANLVVGALNLVPGLPLDGGRVLQSFVWAITGRRSVGVVVAAWGGRVAAVAVLAWPLFIAQALGFRVTLLDWLLAFMIGAFLWRGASQSLVVAKVRSKLPAIQARRLARPAIGVPADLPLAEAIRRAQEANAGSVVVVSHDGRAAGIVNEAAVISTPVDRRPWLPVGDVARRLEAGLSLPADLSGESLLRAMNKTPATEYVLLEPDGSIFGVLVAKDVDEAFRAA
jgi:Zn-dependent protease/CBS domain-containing protein